ncbi:MAG TPA: PVC-type heme-binding CxxCH protein [Gemmataceae bacterium]|jgi:putative membrane-bound dehydrogenase-like protein|nr:PVC-type heme-binding CxxCH protein [Gemmataceae bacterium]
MPRRFLIVLAACGVAPAAFSQKSPEDTVKSMTVADGLQVELFAAEPMVINPTSMDVDHLGRVWVTEAVNYRNKMFKKPLNRPAGDRIQILVDKDGDGKADEAITFYQGPELYGPIGICVAASPNPDKKGAFSYKVFVCQSPDILVFEDKDGDGKADGPPKKFLTGFGGFDHDHGVHGINIGPDGKLYFTVGDTGVNGLQSSDGKGRKYYKSDKDCQAGTVWRCDMDGTNLELLAHNFRNNYECCVNSFGEIWLSDNDDDGNQQTRICYVMPGGNYGYYPRGPGQTHWHEEQPGIVHKTLRTGFGSPTGICFYEGTLLPEKYRGQLLHTDAGPREFRCFHIKPKGAGYELDKENLITSTDSWFRLSDVCVAPDGSVMLADWYDPGVGGHGMGDWTRGRIYRVTPKGHRGHKVPEVKLDNKQNVLATLGSPNQATRWMAIDHMRSMKKDDRDVTALMGFASGDPVLVARANYLLGVNDKIRELVPEDVLKKFEQVGEKLEKDVNVRAYFIRRMPFRDDPRDWSIGVEGELAAEEKEPNASTAVYREFALLVPRLDVEKGRVLFYTLAKKYDGQDIFYGAALNIACGTDPDRRKAILADFDKHFPEWNDKVADLVWELRPPSVLPRLGKLLEDPKLTPAQKGRIVDILAVNDDPAAGKTLLALLGREVPAEIKTRAIDNLKTYLPTKWKDLNKSEELYGAVSGLLKSKTTVDLGLQIGLAAPDCGIASDAEEIAGNKASARETRILAVQVIGKLHHVKYFHKLEELVSDPVVGPAAVTAMGEYVAGTGVNSGGKESLDLLHKLVTDAKTSAELRTSALIALVGSRQGTALLLQLKEKNEMPDTLVADAGRLLRNSPFQGERNKAMLLFPAPGKLDPKKLPSPAVLAQRTGNAARGEKVLATSLKGEAQCLRCHMVRGVGGNIGPDQSMIGKKASKENLFESILFPSKAIADQYVQWKVNTTDGKTVTGLLVAETETSLTLRDANGKDYTFALKDVDGPKQKSLVSIMPDNLVAALTEDELIDLVEYMLTLKTASLTPDSWHILGPFANDASDSALDTDLGLEKLPAVDLTRKLKGRDGQVEWGVVRTGGTGYLDLMAHYGAKSPMSASYLYKVIESPADQDGQILMGNDDGVKVFVNGEKVFENRDHFAAEPGRNKFAVKLKKGANSILIKIVNGNDPHGLYFALTSEQELKAGK